MTILKSDDWCDLASRWVLRNGLEGLDALQRARFTDHASQCAACAAIFQQALQAANADAGEVPASDDWPHLADETLRLLLAGGLSATERALVESRVEPHLEVCDYCADRLAAMEDWPEAPDLPEAVVGRAMATPIPWGQHRAELGWVLDQAATGLTAWRVSLTLEDGILEARLAIDGAGVPARWRFSLPLSSPEKLLPSLVFSPDSLVTRFSCSAAANGRWLTTPILTMPLPRWTRLVSVGEDPATMVSLEDAERLEIALRLPYQGPTEIAGLTDWLNSLMVDLHGDRLACARPRQETDGGFAGSVLDRRGRAVGNWSLRFTPDSAVDLQVRPHPGAIVRLVTPGDGERPHDLQGGIQGRPQTAPRVVPIRQPKATKAPPMRLSLAASGHHSGAGETLVAFAQVGDFKVYENQRDGRVFLAGPVPEKSSFVFLGETRYELRYSAGSAMFEVIGLGSAEMSEFLDEREAAPDADRDTPILRFA